MASAVDFDSELPWLAFRYVAGELGPDEQAAFECRLDQDQAAREAVAEAVELAGAVARARPETVPNLVLARRRRPVGAVLSVAALAAAACLAWVVIVPMHPRGPVGPQRSAVAEARMKPSATVTLAWSTLHLGPEAEKDETSALVAANDDIPTLSEPDDSSEGLPVWLLDAASLAGRRDSAAAPAKEL